MNVMLPKTTGTYADTLQAVGTASLLSELTEIPARIVDKGDSFLIDCANSKLRENWQSPAPGFMFIWRSDKDGAQPTGFVMHYLAERTLAEEERKARAASKAKQEVERALDETEESQLHHLHPEYRLATIIESMRKGWSADKDLYRWINQHPKETLAWIKAKLDDATAANPLPFSNSQLLNPSTGKGVNSPKTVASSANAIPKVLVDPFAEWMKLRGLYESLLAYRVDDDFKFFVIEPGDIAGEHVAMLRRELRDLNLWGGLRLDIQAVLQLVALLVEYSDANEGEIDFFNDSPNRVVRGLRQAYFKSLGTAAALMNDALLPLPDWFPVQTKEDVDAYRQIVNEPYGADRRSGTLVTLRDDRSDDVPILQAYRRWLTSGLLGELLEFHSLFALHLMERLGRNEYVRPFSAETLDLLLKKLRRYPNVKEIVSNSGFRSVARAIRNTTIYAASLESSKREVRFGLAQKWKQRIKGGNEDFLATLAEFVQEQNWEVVHRLRGEGHIVTEDDLNQVVDLVERFGGELVGMLLLAYGYSRAEKVAPKSLKPEAQPVST